MSCPCCQKCLRKLWRFPFPRERESKTKKKFKKFRKWLKYKLWEGDRYDESEIIKSVLHRQNNMVSMQ